MALLSISVALSKWKDSASPSVEWGEDYEPQKVYSSGYRTESLLAEVTAVFIVIVMVLKESEASGP